MTDVTVSGGGGEEARPVGAADAVDDQLIDKLVDRAKAGGVELTGAGGLLQQLTKKVLESGSGG